MSIGKRASGGARSTAAKKARAEAARLRDAMGAGSMEEPVAAIDRLSRQTPERSEDKHLWAAEVAHALICQTLRDPGLTPDQRAERGMRYLRQYVDILEPAKLADDLREFRAVVDEMRSRHAAQEPPRTAAEPPSGSAQH